MSLAIQYHMKRKGKKLAKGGSIEDAHEKQAGVHMPVHSGSGKADKSMAGLLARKKEHAPIARGMHKEKLDELKSMPSPKLPLAEGGSVGCSNCGYAEGGEALADFDSADFDAGGYEDTEANYTGSNSGDELGDEGEEQRRKSALLSYLRRKTG
jgi:hypothetical protein